MLPIQLQAVRLGNTFVISDAANCIMNKRKHLQLYKSDCPSMGLLFDQIFLFFYFRKMVIQVRNLPMHLLQFVCRRLSLTFLEFKWKKTPLTFEMLCLLASNYKTNRKKLLDCCWVKEGLLQTASHCCTYENLGKTWCRCCTSCKRITKLAVGAEV